MQSRIRSAATALALVLVFAAGCGKKDNPTQPPGGGGTPAEPFNSGVFSSGSSPNVFVHTFGTDGTYAYRCTIHGGMTGTIHVATGMPESTTVNITDNAFTPSTAHVRAGGYIKWTASGGNHTVTRP